MFGGWLSVDGRESDETLVFDCFVLCRKNKESKFELMDGKAFTEWGCRMAKLGFELNNPDGEAIVVKTIS